MRKTLYILILLLSICSNAYAIDYKDKFNNFLQQNWPTFKENFSKLTQDAKDFAVVTYFESKTKFDNNLNLLLGNTLFINKVEVSGNHIISNEDAIKAFDLENGKWLWNINLSNSEKNIQQLAWVKSANTKIQIYPSKVQIDVTEHQPWMLVEFSKRLWVVSEQGSLICPVAEIKDIDTLKSLRSLPRLVGLADWEDRTYLKSENARYQHAIKSLKFIEQAGGLPFRLGLIRLLEDGSLQISAAEKSKSYPDIKINSSNTEQAASKIKALKSVLDDLEKRNEQPSNIDLRYEGKAIVN